MTAEEAIKKATDRFDKMQIGGSIDLSDTYILALLFMLDDLSKLISSQKQNLIFSTPGE